MEISKEMLDELKCVQCEKYLTCGPIYVRNTSGEAICGRCTVYEDQPITRNKQYEVVARKILFPCVHADNGCRDKIHFTENKYNTHECNCKFRDRICPVSKSGECDWIGPWTTLVDHCQKEHPNNVLDNPCTLKHDITKDSLNAFLVSAFNVLFILHVKVCVKTAKIYHSLRYLGNPKKASSFKYKLDVQRNEIMLSKPGKVAPEGILTIQINSSLALCVNSLLGFLGDYEGTTFTVTVQKVENSLASVTPKNVNTCLKCAKETKTPNRVCAGCQGPPKTQCINRNDGCDYKEIDNKRVIHERYFCFYRTSCFLCSTQIISGKIHEHYMTEHNKVTYKIGSMFRINQETKSMLYDYCLLSSPHGKLICWYTLHDSFFSIDIMTPLPSDQLEKYQCMIKIKNPKTKSERIFNLTNKTLSNSDWSIQIERSNVPAKKYDIAVFLTEV